jgi:hypothetical protein
MAHDLAAEYPLRAEEWAEVVGQAERMLALLKPLDELPLDDLEPAGVYQLTPHPAAERGGRHD